MTPTFNQNIIAIVWDFDKTLIPYYMQKPLFEEYGVNETSFWSEVNQLPALYKEHGITVSPDTAYLNHILTYVKKGIFKGLNNKKLRSFGAKLDMFPGLPDFFKTCQNIIEANSDYQKFDIKVEHYVVSTGLTEVIKGSSISPFIDGIWGCEFIEDFYSPVDGTLKLSKESEINNIAYLIDNTTKTRALFEINKGVNIHPEEISVNQSMKENDRRVPFENMIYIADGPSDIPAFSVAKKNRAKTFAVYNKDIPRSFKQAKQLVDDKRVDNCFAADYREGTEAFLWLTSEIVDIADRVVASKKTQLRQGKNSVPLHIN
jgi:hypothetical protein